jgi:Transcription factor WhiB
VTKPKPRPPEPEMDWQRHSLCSLPEYRDLPWFPKEIPNPVERRNAKRTVRAICRACPVQVECYTFARQIRATAGVWAGRNYEKQAST